MKIDLNKMGPVPVWRAEFPFALNTGHSPTPLVVATGWGKSASEALRSLADDVDRIIRGSDPAPGVEAILPMLDGEY